LSVPPPSKPDGRVCRIRLSSRWFTSERIDRSGPERRGEIAPAQPKPAKRPCTPVRVVNMASKVIVGLRPVTLAAMVPGGSARRHSHRCGLLRSPRSSSTFLRSLRSMAVTPLPGYYGRSDSCPPVSGALDLNACSTCGQVSLIHPPSLPTVPSPTACACSASPGQGTLPHQRVESGPLPCGNPRLHLSLADSPQHAGRIEFRFLSYWRDFLRTGRSPPAALHPVSRRRSCSRLQVTLTWRGLSPLRLGALSGALGATLVVAQAGHKVFPPAGIIEGGALGWLVKVRGNRIHLPLCQNLRLRLR
jgi:hypothetical protein